MNLFRKHPERENGIVEIGNTDIKFSIFRSRKRKRTIAFKIEHDKSLRVLAPSNASVSAVKKILYYRAAWISRRLAEQEHGIPQSDFTNGSTFSYLGQRYYLHITHGNQAPQSCRLSPHAFYIHVPDATLSSDNLRQEIRLELTLWLKKRARVKLKRRCDIWAEKMGVTYKKLLVTDPQRRWGSCSADNIIRLNWRLMLAPLPIIDYVVAHELAHVRHKNHGPHFWACVARAMPDYLARRQFLRKIESTLNL